jgi:hypothetical protein
MRRDLGVFYTRSWVTHFIVDQTLGRWLQEHGPDRRHDVRLLDPACGSGAFLSEALQYLATYGKALKAERSAPGETGALDQLAIEKAASFLPQIHGIDVLAESVELSKLSLWLKSVTPHEPLDIIDTIVTANTLVDPESDSGYARTALAHVCKGRDFQIIVGNPPWGAALDYEIDHQLGLIEGKVDSYELFIERSLSHLLGADGYLGFIIPDHILRPDGEQLRRYLFDRFSVRAIVKVGEGVFEDVFRAGVILVVQNRLPAPGDTYLGLVIAKGDREQLDRTGTAQLATLVEQRGGQVSRARVVSDPAYNIALAPDEDLTIVDQMKHGAVPWLGDNGIFGEEYGRGEELGIDSFTVQCPACFQWSINPRKRAKRRGGGYESKTCPSCENDFTVEQALGRRSLIAERYDPSNRKLVPIVTGEQVNRYWLEEPLGLRLAVPGMQYKDASLYKGPKLLIRQTSVGIYATVDESDTRCTQSVYVYRAKDGAKGQLEWYLAQLVSRAMVFCFFVETNQVEWQSFPKLTHATLQKLPLVPPDLSSAKGRRSYEEMIDLVRRRLVLAVTEKAGVSARALAIDQEIERRVMDAYGLSPEQRARISARLRPEQNIRIIGEQLYPPESVLRAADD